MDPSDILLYNPTPAMRPDMKMAQLLYNPTNHLSLHRRKTHSFVKFSYHKISSAKLLLLNSSGTWPEIPIEYRQFNSPPFCQSFMRNATYVRFHRRFTNQDKAAETPENETDSRLSKKGVPNPNWFSGTLETMRNSPEVFLEAIIGTLTAISEADPKWKWVSIISPVFVLTLKQFLASNKKQPRNVSFDDLVGIDAAKSQLKVVLSLLQGKSGHKKLGVNLPEGVLLYGHLGTGKTTLVHALAREAKVPFFPVSAKDLAKKDEAVCIKGLFTEAKRLSPSIVYIKDIDVIANKGTSESHPILDKLHTEMDKCYQDGCGRMVAVIVATSTPDQLDPKLMTPGRFFIKVHVAKPDEVGRQKIAALYLKDVLQDDDKEAICKVVATNTHGLVAADLKSIANEAKSIAGERGDAHVTMDDILQALGKVQPNINVEKDEPVAVAAGKWNLMDESKAFESLN